MKTHAAISDPDAFYERLLDAQQGLDEVGRQMFLRRLVLLLANQVGDATVLAECISAALPPEARTRR
jgi:Protein of unknown function (DUF2783)